MRFAAILLFCAGSMAAATLRIPAVAGTITVDGRLDEPLWRDAQSLPLNSPDYGAAFPAGGEVSVAVCGAHMCLAARIPESGRIIAISQGRSPAWWREDLIAWTFAVNFKNRGRRLTLTVNPLGAYGAESTSPDPGVMDGVMATSRAGTNEWTVEAAIPLDKLAPIGFVSVERVRVPRPDAPELRWQYPAPNERMDFELPTGAPASRTEPVFQPARLPAPQRESRTFTAWPRSWPRCPVASGRKPEARDSTKRSSATFEGGWPTSPSPSAASGRR